MARKRRPVNVISMSFLDAMTCGFGAVILFFMIISANVDLRQDQVLEDRSAEARRLELQVDVGRRNLAQLSEQLEDLIVARAAARGARDQLSSQIEVTKLELEELLNDANANEEMIEQLKADLAALQAETESLAAQNSTVEATGDFIRQIRGEGYRQYLTGLRMGGQRLLILVDVSTSMLDRTVVGVFRRRIMDDEDKRQAPKWRQVVDSVEWLLAQIEPGVEFQVIAFNSQAWSVVDGTDGQWLTASAEEIERAMEGLREIVPDGATSLEIAMQAMNTMSPRPDNVYLLVDGLPTMGTSFPNRSGVTGRERVNLFNRVLRIWPRVIPTNVLLYALEGDPMSAQAYWALSLWTGGSMMAPSEDWP